MLVPFLLLLLLLFGVFIMILPYIIIAGMFAVPIYITYYVIKQYRKSRLQKIKKDAEAFRQQQTAEGENANTDDGTKLLLMREFWEKFWKKYEGEFWCNTNQKALDDETVEHRRMRSDENFEGFWQEFKDKFGQDENQSLEKSYQLLGLPLDASYHEVRHRFCELALKYHPDKNKTKTIQAANKFVILLEAYEKITEKMVMEECTS